MAHSSLGTHQTFTFFKRNIAEVVRCRHIQVLPPQKQIHISVERIFPLLKQAIRVSETAAENVEIHGYLNGTNAVSKDQIQHDLKAILKSKNWLQKLERFPYSIQVRDMQRLDPQLFQFCQMMGQSLNWDYSIQVNMYITPGKERNCFEFHTDPHASMIYQVLGQKKWLFPQIQSRYLSAYNPMRPLPSFESSKVKSHLLKENHWLLMPEGAIHKAEIRGAKPSIHLTFSFFTNRTPQGVADFFEQRLKEVLDLSELRFKKLGNRELQGLLKKIESQVREVLEFEKVDCWNRTRNMTQFKQNLGTNRSR